MSEEQLLQEALAMSMTVNGDSAAPATAALAAPMQTDTDDADLSEEQLLEQALAMSMDTNQPPTSHTKDKPK